MSHIKHIPEDCEEELNILQEEYIECLENLEVCNFSKLRNKIGLIPEIISEKIDVVVNNRTNEESKISSELKNITLKQSDIINKQKNLSKCVKKEMKELDELKLTLSHKKQELKNLKDNNKNILSALKIAQKAFNDLTGIVINVNEVTDDYFVADVLFDEDKPNYVAKFKISFQDKNILDLDTSSFLSPLQHDKLMEHFGKYDNMLGLMSTLQIIIESL